MKKKIIFLSLLLYTGFVCDSAQSAVNSQGVKGSTVALDNNGPGGGYQKNVACTTETIGQTCTATGADKAVCQNIGNQKVACVSKKCKQGYLLELYSNNGKSKGICIKLNAAKAKCEKVKNNISCGEGQELVPFPIANPNDTTGDPFGAYKECFCANTNLVTYNCGDGTGTPPIDTTPYTNIQTITIKQHDGCTKEGAKFSHWLCDNTEITEGQSFTIETPMECVAQWTDERISTVVSATPGPMAPDDEIPEKQNEEEQEDQQQEQEEDKPEEEQKEEGKEEQQQKEELNEETTKDNEITEVVPPQPQEPQPTNCPTASTGTYPDCKCDDKDKKYDKNQNECLVDELKKKQALEEKQKAYDEAKAKEQSTANKTLTALTTAATGIGGMELLQGMAEQSADKDATADMAAYIETMRCTYGEGKQVKASLEEIELPGANDQTLMNLRSEYLALATDLKERKEALGMKPGIESEEILDRATSGLYDDENIGITSGNYESLYRAQMLSSETDQTKIDDAASKSKNRVIAGAVVGGVGVIGGILGNSLINGKLGEKLKQKKANKDNSNKEESALAEQEVKALEDLKKCLSDAGIKDKDDWGFRNFYPSVLTVKNINCRNIKLKNNQRPSDVKASEIFADSDDENIVFDSMDKYFDMITISKMVGYSKEETVSNIKTKIKTSLANAKEKITQAQEKDKKDASASSGGGLSDIASSLLSSNTLSGDTSSILAQGETSTSGGNTTNLLGGVLGGLTGN